MARQKSFLKFEGVIGDITFYKMLEEYYARTRTGVSGERVKTDPQFERTRENGREFGRATKAARVLRTAIRPLIIRNADHLMTGRLNKEMVKVLQSDPVCGRGERTVTNGDLGMLSGFEFNDSGHFKKVFQGGYTTMLDRGTGELGVRIPSFVPDIMVTPPSGATHFQFRCAGVDIDFETEKYAVQFVATEEISLGFYEYPEISLLMRSTHESTRSLFVVLGITFMMSDGGKFYPLNNGLHNALVIAGASNVSPVKTLTLPPARFELPLPMLNRFNGESLR